MLRESSDSPLPFHFGPAVSSGGNNSSRARLEDPVIDQLQAALERLDWIKKARVRLREDGDVLTGEAFIEPRDDRDLLDRLAQAREVAHSVDWRLYDVNMVPVRSVDE